MTTLRADRPNPKHAGHTPAPGFDPRGVSERIGGGSMASLLLFLAFGTAMLVTVHVVTDLTPGDLAESPVLSFFTPLYLIPLVMLTASGLLSQRRSRVQLDPEGGGVMWTWSAFVPYKSRRDPVDFSAVHEVRLETKTRTARFLTSGIGADATSEHEVVHYSAILDGASPPRSYGCGDYSWTRAVAEHFALGLGVPLRLSDDDVRAPELIFMPLRDRLTGRQLEAPVAEKRGRLSADNAAVGTTRVVLPARGVTGQLVIDAIGLLVVLAIVASFPMIWLAPNGPLSPRGLLGYGSVAAFVLVCTAFRARTSAVVTVLADGGFELVRRFPIGRRTHHIAGDDLDDISLVKDPTENENLLEAEGRHESYQFGHGLAEDEAQWLESVLQSAVAGRSSLASTSS